MSLDVAVVGLGWWGRTVVRLLESSPQLRVVLGVDVRGADVGDIPVVLEYEECLRNPKVHGVILCTPHSQHVDQIVRAAEARKHVFCEKPLALSRADVLRAVDACNRSGVVLAVGHEKRFEPPIWSVFRMVREGRFGTPLQIEANFSQDKFLTLPQDNWRLSSAEAPAGPMTATGIHLLDLAVGLLGPAERVYASVRQLGSELSNGDTLAVQVNFKSGASASLSAMLATPFDGRFAVYGSKGWVEVRDKAHPEAPQGWSMTVSLREGGRHVVQCPPSRAVLANLEAFAAAAGGGPPYPVPQSDMIANVSALEAIFHSAEHRKVQEVAA